MLHSNKNREDLEKLNESVLVRTQVKASRLQVKLRKKTFQEHMKEVVEPVTEFLSFVTDVTISLKM